MDNKKINISIILILGLFILLTQGKEINEKFVNIKKQIEPYFYAIISDNIKNQINTENFLENSSKNSRYGSENYDGLEVGIGIANNSGVVGFRTKDISKLHSAINPKILAEIEKNIKKNPYSVGDADYSGGSIKTNKLEFTYDEQLNYYKSDYLLNFEFPLRVKDLRISYLFVLINIIFISLAGLVLYAKAKEEKIFKICIFVGFLWAIIAFLISMSAGLGGLATGYPGSGPSLGFGLLFPTYAAFLIYTPFFSLFLFLINPLIIGGITPVLLLMGYRKIKNINREG